MNRGWSCPNCGGCYSPATPQCFNCTGRYSTSDGCELRGPHLSHNTIPPNHMIIDDKEYKIDENGQINIDQAMDE